MAKKTSRKLVAMCSGAVLATYLTGYSLTQQPAASQAQIVKPSCVANINDAAPVVRGYRDGIYCGAGSSRFGGVEVAVTISGGKIQGVRITRVTTYFPESRIDGLPAQVMARQSADVDVVTGATGSTEAFQGAVQQALAQAKRFGAQTGVISLSYERGESGK